MSDDELAEQEPPLIRDPNGDIRPMTEDEKNNHDAKVLGLSPEDWNKIGQAFDAGMLAMDVIAVLGVIFPEPSSSIAGAALLARRMAAIRKAWKAWNKVSKKGGDGSTGGGKPPRGGSGGEPPRGGKPDVDYTSNNVPKNEVPDFVNPADGPFTRTKDGRIRNRVGDTVADVDGGKYIKPGAQQDSTGSTWTGRQPPSSGGGGKPPRGGGGGKPPRGGGKPPRFTDPTTGRPLDPVDPSTIKRPDGKPLDPLPPVGGSTGGGKTGGKKGSFRQWWNKGRNERIKNENDAPFGNPLDQFAKESKKTDKNTLFGDDRRQRGQEDTAFDTGKDSSIIGRPDKAVLGRDLNPRSPKFGQKVAPERGGPGSGPTPLVRQTVERPIRGIKKGIQKIGSTDNIGKQITQQQQKDIIRKTRVIEDKVVNNLKNENEINGMIKKSNDAGEFIQRNEQASNVLDKAIRGAKTAVEVADQVGQYLNLSLIHI